MFKSKYHICELFGIPVYLDISFAILLFIFITVASSISFGFATALVLAISVVLHECAHALTARAFGYRTNDITISLLGGCASMIALPRKAYQEFLTALAGPLMSFLIAFGVLLLEYNGVRIENNFTRALLDFTKEANFYLGGFNLLPGFPMDGGRIFRSAMRLFTTRVKATLIAMWVGRVVAILLGIYGLFSIFSNPWGFVACLIAYMIWKEGYREYLLARQEDDVNRPWTQADFCARVSPPPYER